MIVSLSDKANPDQVKKSLIARGLWIETVLRDGAGKVRQLSIASYSLRSLAPKIEGGAR